MMLSGLGAADIPAGGSCWRRLKSRISRRRAAVDMVYSVVVVKVSCGGC